MTTWTNVDKASSGVSEVDFLFSDGSDFLFSDGSDFVFREERTSIQWINCVKNLVTWANPTKN